MSSALSVHALQAESAVSGAETYAWETEVGKAVLAYLDHPRPLFTKLPVSYQRVPLELRVQLLGALARRHRTDDGSFPAWPIEGRIDAILPSPDRPHATFVLTHDIDSRRELEYIVPLRNLERSLGLVSSFGFVPERSWPPRSLVENLIAEGCEMYWHDIAHNGQLPYMPRTAIVDAFDRVLDRDPWVAGTMRAFRTGQLLASRTLFEVVAERFDVDMSLPDTERGGPYGRTAGCGTVRPFRLGSMVELPLTLPQDVFLWQVEGLGPDQGVDVWRNKLKHIKALGGIAVLNIHPHWVNPDRPRHLAAVSQFLAEIAADENVTVTTPSTAASGGETAGVNRG